MLVLTFEAFADGAANLFSTLHEITSLSMLSGEF
jgi:hypothetical protein